MSRRRCDRSISYKIYKEEYDYIIEIREIIRARNEEVRYVASFQYNKEERTLENVHIENIDELYNIDKIHRAYDILLEELTESIIVDIEERYI